MNCQNMRMEGYSGQWHHTRIGGAGTMTQHVGFKQVR